MTKGPDFLRWQVHDATLRFQASPPDLKLHRARKLVQAKFERGDYEVLQMLDEPTLDAMARAMVEGRGEA